LDVSLHIMLARSGNRDANYERCPEQFALTEISFVIVRMAQRFEKIEPLDPGEGITHGLRLSLVPIKGAKIRLFQGAKG